MKKLTLIIVMILLTLISCGENSTKKRNLDDTLFKYAALIRWSSYDEAIRFLKPDMANIHPSSFELQKLKQFKISRYLESPISPGKKENEILQTVEIQLYNIHTNTVKTIYDYQIWEYSEDLKQWFLISGIPKIQ